MNFYGLNLGLLAQGHLGPWDLHLNKLSKRVNGYEAKLHTKFQTPGPSGFEKEDF